MVPQLLPPVAATTIGTPTQSTIGQKPSSSGMRGDYSVYILFCAISSVPPPIPVETWNTHIFNAKSTCYLRTHLMCAHEWVHIRWTERKPDVNFRTGAAWWGRASQAGSQIGLQADNELFSKHSGGRALGSGYLKHLAPFISPPWKWIRLWLWSARANEVIWFPRAPSAF